MSRDFFACLNHLERGHVLQTFLQRRTQEVVAFFKNFAKGVFQKDFDAAFFKRSHVGKIQRLLGQAKRSGGRQFLADGEFIALQPGMFLSQPPMAA